MPRPATTSSSRPPRTPSQAGPPARRPRADTSDDAKITFRLSKATARAIDAALRGLSKPQQDRVLHAVDQVGQEMGAKVSRHLEKELSTGAGEFLAAFGPWMTRDEMWRELQAIWFFLHELGIEVDHDRVAAAVGQSEGAHIAKRYREQVKAFATEARVPPIPE